MSIDSPPGVEGTFCDWRIVKSRGLPGVLEVLDGGCVFSLVGAVIDGGTSESPLF